jgi:hypothetical protein
MGPGDGEFKPEPVRNDARAILPGIVRKEENKNESLENQLN